MKSRQLSIRMMLIPFLSLLLHASLQAQDATEELMKQLTGFTWQLDGSETTQDTYRPILNGHFVLFSTTGMAGGPADIGVVGVHPETNKWTWWMFRGDGSVDVSEFNTQRQTDGKLFVSAQGIEGLDASKLKMAYSFDFSQSRAIMEGAGVINGKEMPIKMAWDRIPLVDQSWLKAEPPGEVPKPLTFVTHLTGPKCMATEFGGETGVGASMGKWILDGKFFLYTASRYRGEEHVQQLAIGGLNPSTGSYQSWEFGGDGSVALADLAEDGMSISGRLVSMQPPNAGEELQFQGRFEVVDGELVYSSEIGPEVGEKTPYTWKWYTPKGNQIRATKADPREKAKELAFLIGEWEFDENGVQKKLSAKWINNDSFVQEVQGSVMRIWGWDVEQQEFAVWTFGGVGGYGRATVTKEKDGWHINGTPYYIANGDAVTNNAVLQMVDEDTQRVTGQFANTKVNLTLRRVK